MRQATSTRYKRHENQPVNQSVAPWNLESRPSACARELRVTCEATGVRFWDLMSDMVLGVLLENELASQILWKGAAIDACTKCNRTLIAGWNLRGRTQLTE